MEQLKTIWRKWQSGERGFTLVELLVVISIIGVLATLVLLQLGTARSKARDAKRISDVNQIRSAVEQYFEDNGGEYPVAITAAELSDYMTQIPVDPLTGNAYEYSWTPVADPTGFRIGALLEGTAQALLSDADINTTGWSGVASNLDDSTCSTTPANCYYDQGTN
jgi:prepilin-type N-terminal cleavage/methylation domain-containing protein